MNFLSRESQSFPRRSQRKYRDSRKVVIESKEVSTNEDRVLDKYMYQETLPCIIGNSFPYRTDEEKGKVSETIIMRSSELSYQY